ncbi:MAG: 4-hydroxy-tetrahydrodipicolinate synthase [Roseivirga sp.]|nr:4-hydroxy-tetrahydrodipicolinate synthase [Roseivirga sp.]
MRALQGTGVALITPFNEDLSVDFDGLKNLLKHVSKAVDYLVIHGTTGEAATTTQEEKTAIFDFIRNNNTDNLPLVYGIGGNNTQAVIDTIKATDLKGVTALLSVSPYYNKPSQEGIYQHYLRIAQASPVPVILYNVPGRTMSKISADTTLRLAAHANIIGTKEASGDLAHCERIAKESPDNFILVSGDDLLTRDIINVGGTGVISVIANGLPEEMNDITANALNGNDAAAKEATEKLQAINPLFYEESNPVGIKEVLKFREVCGNQVRLPLLPATSELSSKIQTELNKL